MYPIGAKPRELRVKIPEENVKSEAQALSSRGAHDFRSPRLDVFQGSVWRVSPATGRTPVDQWSEDNRVSPRVGDAGSPAVNCRVEKRLAQSSLKNNWQQGSLENRAARQVGAMADEIQGAIDAM
jgi:hypothetical protein